MLPSILRRTSRILAGLTILFAGPLVWPQHPTVLAGMRHGPWPIVYAAAVASQWASVTPLTISANKNGDVTVTARIPAKYGDSLEPHVFRLDRQTGAATDLGVLRPQKTLPNAPTIPYLATIQLHEAAAGQILLQVRVSLAQTVPGKVAERAQTSSSQIMTVTVLAAAAANKTSNNNDNKPSSNDNEKGSNNDNKTSSNNTSANKSNSSGIKNQLDDRIPLESKTLAIRYPKELTFNQQAHNAGGPISLRTFTDYARGGVVPTGGCDIEITNTPVSASSIDATLTAEVGNASHTTETVGGLPAVRATYTDAYPGFSLSSIAVYVANGNLLHKFFLTWRTGDASQTTCLDKFNKTLQTVRFK